MSFGVNAASFVAPVAYTVELPMLWSDQSRIVTSGLSALAIGSFIAVGGIVGGCIAALKYQYWRSG